MADNNAADVAGDEGQKQRTNNDEEDLRIKTEVLLKREQVRLKSD